MSDDPNNPDLHLEHYQDGYNAGEQAGFERGVRAEREAWIAGNRGMDAGRAERDAEVAAHLKELLGRSAHPDARTQWASGRHIALAELLAWLEQP